MCSAAEIERRPRGASRAALDLDGTEDVMENTANALTLVLSQTSRIMAGSPLNFWL